MQYASKYYDPVKAHEYYEAHKKLKGRKHSTATLNDKGKAAARYVKDRINAEKKNQLERERERYKNEVAGENERYKNEVAGENERRNKEAANENEAYRKKVLANASVTKSRVSSLQEKYSRLSASQKKILGPAIKKELERIKSQNATQRNRLKTSHSNTINSINEKSSNTKKSMGEKHSGTKKSMGEKHSTNRKNINDKYSKLYDSEVGKMNSDASMAKEKKTKKKSESSKSPAYQKALKEIQKKTTWKK